MSKESPKLEVFYRASSFENPKTPRPKWFSKVLCLKNFINAFAPVAPIATFHLVYDGVVEKDFLELAEPVGTVTELPSVGNAPSCWHALQEAAQLPDETLAYFVEDDYLHCPEALIKLIDCHHDVVADYITLYDHPVRYMTDYFDGNDWPLVKDAILLSRSHHWRTVESTCMTFAASAGVLKKDMEIFDTYVGQVEKPQDRALFRHLQGLGKYRDCSSMRLRLLIGPVPSLATHCHEPWLAPLVDWSKLAQQIK